MGDPPKTTKGFVVSKVIPTGGLDKDKKSAKEEPAEEKAEESKEAPKPGGVAKRVMSFQVGSKPKK